MPVKSYKTSQLRRERFKKSSSCRSAPLVHPNGKDKSTDEYDEFENEPGTLNGSRSAVELENSAPEVSVPLLNSVVKNQEADPILAYITTARYKLGLGTKPERYLSMLSSADAGTTRETAIAGSGPITGVKDLKLLSRRLSSLSDTMAAHGSVEFVYALRSDIPSKFNPYDLRIVSAEEARTHQSYYTISAYSVTQVLCCLYNTILMNLCIDLHLVSSVEIEFMYL